MSADFPDDMGGHPRQPDDERTLQDLLALQTLKDPTKVVTVAPTEHFRLGYLSVACLVINRIIGGFLLSVDAGAANEVARELTARACRHGHL